MDIVKDGTDGDLYFQQVDFEIPSFLHGPIQPKFPPDYSIGLSSHVQIPFKRSI